MTARDYQIALDGLFDAATMAVGHITCQYPAGRCWRIVNDPEHYCEACRAYDRLASALGRMRRPLAEIESLHAESLRLRSRPVDEQLRDIASTLASTGHSVDAVALIGMAVRIERGIKLGAGQ